jgi:hypothetical protein
MKVELRNWVEIVNGVELMRTSLILVPTKEESNLIDKVFGSNVNDDDSVGVSLVATAHLSDGYGAHYIRIGKAD